MLRGSVVGIGGNGSSSSRLRLSALDLLSRLILNHNQYQGGSIEVVGVVTLKGIGA